MTFMNKKGNLLPEETLKIVIAVICIGFLIILIVSIYFSLTGAEKTKQAETQISNPNGFIKTILRTVEGNTTFKLVPNPADWYIFSFKGDRKPNLCTGQNCICICEDVLYIFDWQKRLINKCDDKGACALISNFRDFEKIKIEKTGTNVSADKINGELIIKRQ